jgi:hypothetical protein
MKESDFWVFKLANFKKEKKSHILHITFLAQVTNNVEGCFKCFYFHIAFLVKFD